MTNTTILPGHPIKFGWSAIKDFEEKTGIVFIAFLRSFEAQEYTTENLIKLAWCGLKCGYRVDKKEFTLTEEDVADIIDNFPGAMFAISELAVSSYISAISPGNVEQPVKKTAMKKVS